MKMFYKIKMVLLIGFISNISAFADTTIAQCPIFNKYGAPFIAATIPNPLPTSPNLGQTMKCSFADNTYMRAPIPSSCGYTLFQKYWNLYDENNISCSPANGNPGKCRIIFNINC